MQGLKAYKSVADLPPTDLAALIIPAKFVPQELERCGKAGIKAAIILSSGFAEEKGEAGPALQCEVQAIAQKYDMAVSGPNGEGFANTAASLCPTFSPAMDAGDVPLLPRADRTRGPGRSHFAERRHGLCVLRSRAAEGIVVPLHHHDRQRGVPFGQRLRRVHHRRRQDRRHPDADRGHQECRDLRARRRQGAARRCAADRQPARRFGGRARAPSRRTRRRGATMRRTGRCSGNMA